MPEPGGRPVVAFESARLTYTDHAVDLYNSGVNQLLSLAAVRGHPLRHFRMADLYRHEGATRVRTSVLALEPGWAGDPVDAWQHLRPVGTEDMALAEIGLYFVRGDDIRRADSPNVELLRDAERHAIVIESVAATLSTCDKYELVRRCPDVAQPITFAAQTVEEALAHLERLPLPDGWFILKDRYGYGCGAQVHRLRVDTPGIEHTIDEFVRAYGDILIQEFRPEVAEGDLVVTFLDDELLGTMRRVPVEGEWKTNASLGATQVRHELTPEQAEAAWTVRRAFPECRLASVDLLTSGRVIEINAFPGGDGLLETHGVVLAERVLDRLEAELAGGRPPAPTPAATNGAGASASRAADLERRITRLYHRQDLGAPSISVVDVFAHEVHDVGLHDLIEIRPAPGNDQPGETPVVVSVPHAGVLVPERFIDRFPRTDEILVEIDLFSHLLYEQLPATQVVSRLAPFFLDMNRGRAGADEPHVPHHLHNPPHEYYTIEDELILTRPYSDDEADQILGFYDLYHGLVDALVEECRRRYGWALLIDGHSMTSVGLGRVHDEGQARDNVVVGTLGGASADPAVIDAFVGALREGFAPYELGISVAEDVPYSGGFITRAHHDPDNGIHALQIEVTMDTYMYEADAEAVRRYTLKQHRLEIVRAVLADAVAAAMSVRGGGAG